MDTDHTRPAGASDRLVEAVGKISEALEATERARGHLYAFHQLTGGADFTLDEAVSSLREEGHDELAELISAELIGRNVLAGRWTFQIVEEYDDGYYATFKSLEKRIRDELMQGRRHVFEAELKEQRRTHGKSGHASRPD
jgi:hypothetical protein